MVFLCKMNTLLNLALFKSLGFFSKESGIEFVKQNPKLQKEIQLKVDELEEAKYLIVESIKDEVFSKYDDKKEVFLIKSKNERNEKLVYKKELQKKALKEEMKAELLKEIKEEEMDEKKKAIMKRYPKAIPIIDKTINIEELQNLFFKVMTKIQSGEIDEDELSIVEKTKEQVEKALLVLTKATKILDNY
jgi:hypothetical protein